MISIVNYGMGNIRSIRNALTYLGVKSRVIDSPKLVLESERLILPGVGSFRLAMENLRQRALLDALDETVLKKKTPILGICLGMQLMAKESEEDGLTQGLGWIQALLKRFPAEQTSLKVPHVGFDTVIFEQKKLKLFKGLGNKADYYFAHSFRISYGGVDEVSGWTEYGERFVASIEKDNIFGTQFHPEKSQNNGLILLKNFAELEN